MSNQNLISELAKIKAFVEKAMEAEETGVDDLPPFIIISAKANAETEEVDTTMVAWASPRFIANFISGLNKEVLKDPTIRELLFTAALDDFGSQLKANLN